MRRRPRRRDAAVFVLQSLVLPVAIGLVLLARHAAARQWLSWRSQRYSQRVCDRARQLPRTALPGGASGCTGNLPSAACGGATHILPFPARLAS